MGILVSFIVPAYNEEERLRRCLDKILEQQEYSIEILCIDDASTDKTLAIFNEYALQNSNIRVFHNEKNQGLGYSRNVGLDHANGKYIWFIDADDYIANESVNKLISIAERERLDVLCFDLERITETDKFVVSYKLPYMDRVIKGEELFVNISKSNRVRASVCCQLYKKDFLHSINIRFRENAVAEDAYFSMKALILADRVLYFNKAYYIYHKSQNSISTSTAHEKYFLGTFSSYCDMLYFWSNGEWNKELSESMVAVIGKYYKLSVKHFEGCKQVVINSLIEQIGGYIEKQYQLFVEIQRKSSILGKLSEEKIDAIRRFKNIIVFGAGTVARELVTLIDGLEKEIIAYAVSKESKNNPESIFGVQVKSIEELTEYRETALVIIAISSNRTSTVLHTLEKLEFKNVLQIT